MESEEQVGGRRFAPQGDGADQIPALGLPGLFEMEGDLPVERRHAVHRRGSPQGFGQGGEIEEQLF